MEPHCTFYAHEESGESPTDLAEIDRRLKEVGLKDPMLRELESAEADSPTERCANLHPSSGASGLQCVL